MLETEIKNLTAQIEQLNANFAQFFSVSTQEVKADKPVKQVKQEEVETSEPTKEQVKEKTRDDLRELCLVKVRSDRKLKDKIFKIFGEFGGQVVDDLKDEDVNAVFEKVAVL